MYRDRIQNLATKSPAAERLKKVLIDYHDFKYRAGQPVSQHQLMLLADWQCQRLKDTHRDLYQSQNYHQGLNFLFSDLYAPQDFSDRDRDLERIAPKLVKLLPDKVILTLAELIELNLQTQRLDVSLAHQIFNCLNYQKIDEASYCHAYRACNNEKQRQDQLASVHEVGKLLNRYARSRMLNFSLSISERPAEMAGLTALYSFIRRGFDAFHDMQDIPFLMDTLLKRESHILQNIYANQAFPFQWQESSHDKRCNDR